MAKRYSLSKCRLATNMFKNLKYQKILNDLQEKSIKQIILASIVLLGLGAGTAVTVPMANQTTPTTVQAAAIVPYKIQPADADTGENIGDPIALTGEMNSTVTDFPKLKGYMPIEGQSIKVSPNKILNVTYQAVKPTNLTINYVAANNTIATETKAIDYNDSGNINLKNDLGDQYTFGNIEIGTNDLGLKANSDNTAIAYNNENKDGGDITLTVNYKEAATLTINSIDENGNALTDPKTIDGQIVGTNYEGKLDKQITVDDKSYTLQSWADADDASINGTGDALSFALNKAATTINATYKAAESTSVTIDYITEAGTKLASEIQTINYGDEGAIALKNDLGTQYVLKNVVIGDNAIGLKANADNTTIAYDNQNTNGGSVTIEVIYAELATVTIDYVDGQGNLLKTEAIKDQILSQPFQTKLAEKIKIGASTYRLISWQVNDAEHTSGKTATVDFVPDQNNQKVTVAYQLIEPETDHNQKPTQSTEDDIGSVDTSNELTQSSYDTTIYANGKTIPIYWDMKTTQDTGKVLSSLVKNWQVKAEDIFLDDTFGDVTVTFLPSGTTVDSKN